MTTVYCVFSGSYEDRGLDAVYARLEDAQAMDHGHTPRWSERGPDRWRCEWTLVHHRARVPVGVTLERLEIPVVGGLATLPDGRTVRSNAKSVIVPVLPEGANIGPIIDRTEYCDYDIEAHELR